jgi:hypothetical protein
MWSLRIPFLVAASVSEWIIEWGENHSLTLAATMSNNLQGSH